MTLLAKRLYQREKGVVCVAFYQSPVGKIKLISKEDKLIKLEFLNQDLNLLSAKEICEKCDEVVLKQTREWLDEYFNGKNPSFKVIPLNPNGSEFAKVVWELLLKIPYGKVCTYGELAKEIARITHKNKMSAQAIGGALKRNPIPIIIPCHRVIGANGKLTGYAGGIKKKIALLECEKADLVNLYHF